jgi:hypothetical protein
VQDDSDTPEQRIQEIPAIIVEIEQKRTATVDKYLIGIPL